MLKLLSLVGPPPAYNAISHSVRPAVTLTPSTEPVVSVFGSTTAKNTSSNSALANLDILDQSLQDYKLSKETFPVKS